MVERTNYGQLKSVITPPDQIEIQTKSFNDFLQPDVAPAKRANVGLQGIFNDIFPVESYDGNCQLEFVSYELRKSDPPSAKDNPLTALREGVTYSASLHVTFRLKNKEARTEQTVYMGEIPLMTEDGAFVINGAERVIVSQLHRSPGICTERDIHTNGTPIYSVRIIPDRGSWLELAFDTDYRIWALMDRRRKKRKFLASTFLRALGYSTDREILENFYTYETISLTSGISQQLQRRIDKKTLVFPEDVRDPGSNALLVHRYDYVERTSIDRLIEAGFKNVEVINVIWDEGVFIRTMRDDPTTNEEEALKEVYHKLRPGDPVTASNASQLLKHQFFDPHRYNLGKVGRYKLNTKLEKYRDIDRGETRVPDDQFVLDNRDVIAALRMLAAVSTQRKAADRPIPQWKAATHVEIDDIDHLGSRRIRTAGELLENQCRIGLTRTERVIHERMSAAASQTEADSSEKLQPTRLVNSKTFGAVVNDFLARSQLSQFMDQTNPLSGLAHKRRLSALGPGGLSRDRAGFEVRDVHPSHYGRICPIETPEGPNIGLISSLGIYAHINEYGFVETPYRKVVQNKDGVSVVTDEVVYMSADEEEQYIVAQANAPLDEKNQFVNPMVRVRYRSEFQEAPRERVQFMDVSPMQVISIAAGLIPFLEHDDANRALMGANMMRQAVPLLRTERPHVATGLEGQAARDSRVVVVFDGLGQDGTEDGIVAEVDALHIVVTKDGHKPTKSTSKNAVRVYNLQKFRRTNASTCFNQWPIVSQGQIVKKGDVLADGPATDQGELAIGKNLLVAYMPWCGYNFEDSILVSQRVLRDDIFTSVHISEVECKAQETQLGHEEITRDIPNLGEDALRNLDARGVVCVGAEVNPGDILVGKITPKSQTEDLTPEERLVRAVFGTKGADVRDTSLRVQPGTTGIVMDVKVSDADDSRGGRRASTASTPISLGGSKRKPVTEESLRKEYDKKKKECLDALTKNLARKLQNDKISIDIMDGATGDCLIPANQKISKALIDTLVEKRDSISIAPSPAHDEIMGLVEPAREALAALDDELYVKIAELEDSNSEDNKGINSVKVYIAEKKILSVGDKLSGRHGNKGVVCRILPDCDMPFLPNGQPMDIILNPMGVPSRMNLGQVFETHLGAACRALGKYAGTPVFDGVPEAKIHEMLGEASKQPDFGWIKEDGKSVLYDGRTGEPFDQRVMVGVTYMLKLHHLVTDKIHARAVGPYSLVTQQPLGGKAQAGGQRMGEMEVWALEAYGVAYALQEMITVKSDDSFGRTRIYESIVKGQNYLQAGIPETFKVLINELKGLCLDMKLESADGNDNH